MQLGQDAPGARVEVVGAVADVFDKAEREAGLGEKGKSAR